MSQHPDDAARLRQELGHDAVRDLLARIEEGKRSGRKFEIPVVIEGDEGKVGWVIVPRKHVPRTDT